MGDSDSGYQFGTGIGEEELARLESQGAAIAPATRMIFTDLSTIRSLPETPEITQVKSWLVEAFARAGLVMLGPRLWAVVQEAGLRPLGMVGVQPHFGSGDEVGLAYIVEGMRAAEPVIVGTGVATAEEIGMETFEQRLRDTWGKDPQAVAAAPMLLSVWATTGPE